MLELQKATFQEMSCANDETKLKKIDELCALLEKAYDTKHRKRVEKFTTEVNDPQIYLGALHRLLVLVPEPICTFEQFGEFLVAHGTLGFFRFIALILTRTRNYGTRS